MPTRRVDGRKRSRPSRRQTPKKVPKVLFIITRAEAVRIAQQRETVAVCSVCGKIRVTKQIGKRKAIHWVDVGITNPEKGDPRFSSMSHGYCPTDARRVFEELKELGRRKS